MLDAKSERAIARLTDEVRHLFGADLVSLVLYGSAVGEDFIPGQSDLNLAIVLDRLRFADLQALQRHLAAWHRLGAATPLLMDRQFLARARDVFPMELRDIQAQHRVLFGEEVFATLCIDGRHLRYQAEHEARSKLLRLRVLFAEVGADRRRLRALMLDSVKTFVIVMRNLCRLRGGEGPPRYLAALDEFERLTALSFPAIRRLVRIKLGLEPWPDGLDETFASYLDEVERLVDLTDRMVPEVPMPPVADRG